METENNERKVVNFVARKSEKTVSRERKITDMPQGGLQWIRVHGPDLCPRKAINAKANLATKNNPLFEESCVSANIRPTIRQASKWNNKKGLAYKHHVGIETTGYPIV